MTRSEEFEYRKDAFIALLKESTADELSWFLCAVVHQIKLMFGYDGIMACFHAFIAKRTEPELVDMKDAVDNKLYEESRKYHKYLDASDSIKQCEDIFFGGDK